MRNIDFTIDFDLFTIENDYKRYYKNKFNRILREKRNYKTNN